MKRARPDRDDRGGAAAKVQTQQQPIEERSVVVSTVDQLPPGRWARRSGMVASNSAPAVEQVHRHTCYALVHSKFVHRCQSIQPIQYRPGRG